MVESWSRDPVLICDWSRVSPISSAMMSLSSTCKNTPTGGSPKSPPNSPNVELADFR